MTDINEIFWDDKYQVVYELLVKDISLLSQLDIHDIAWRNIYFNLVISGKENPNYSLGNYSDFQKVLAIFKKYGEMPKSIPQAASFQDKERIKELLSQGIRIDEEDFGEKSGLMIAAILNDYTLTKFFIDNGAFVNNFDQENLEAIDYTTDIEIISLLKSNGGKTKEERNEILDDYYSAVEFSNDFRDTQIEFMTGAEKGDIKQMEKTLNRPKGIWVLNGTYPVNGKTALHLAVEKNKIESVKFLISKGLDKNKSDHNGETPSQIAKRLNLTDIEKILNTN